jgi:transmembrane sensor
VKHLLGETSAYEQEQVHAWLKEDLANQVYYEELKKIWEKSRELIATTSTDENKAWNSFIQRVNKIDEGNTKNNRFSFSWLRLAAAIVVFTGITLILYQLLKPSVNSEQTIVQTDKQVLNDTLPDGSIVTLNKMSEIHYAAKFEGNERKIVLKGEAFFNVTPDKEKPFIIDINEVKVTVVGTSFNVKGTKEQTEIVVESGLVKVTSMGQTIELKAGERTTVLNKDTVMYKEEVSDKLYNHYRSREFVCDDTPLWKLVDVLNEAYDTNIVIERKELRDLRLNTTFYNESLDKILEVISLTFTIKVTRTSEKIILQ